jgi:acyl carrier protein
MPPPLIAFAVPYWLQVAAFPGILFAFCCAMFTWELLRCRWARRQHVASHPEMDDGEFIRRVGLGRAQVEGEAACRIRHAVAKLMHVPPLTLHPFDELGYIAAFGFDGLDFFEIAWAIENALDVRIPERRWDAFFKSNYRDDLSSLIRFLFEQQNLATERATPSAALGDPLDSAPTPSSPSA